MQIRLVIMSDDSGENESVLFTPDFRESMAWQCKDGQTIVFDKVIDADLPGIFPANYVLHRE